MATHSAEVVIQGISPLLMHSYPFVKEEALEKLPPEEQAEKASYRTPEGKLYVPGVNIQRSLVAAATFSKGKGRASLQKVVAACVMISPEYVLLSDQSYIVDVRPVVIPATGGRVLRYRPRINTWQLTFTVEWDPVLMKDTEVRRVIDDAGSRVGLLDFRPERKGPFGRFMVIEWKCGK